MKCFICSVVSRSLSSSVFVRRSHWCIYFQILYNTMSFCKWKLNLIWSCKSVICKRITEYTCWSVGVRLTHHIEFCTCNDITPKEILACVGACECDRTPFIDRRVCSKVHFGIISLIKFSQAKEIFQLVEKVIGYNLKNFPESFGKLETTRKFAVTQY